MLIHATRNDEDDAQSLINKDQEKQLYFKVYQDKDHVGKNFNHYVATEDEALQEIKNAIDSGEFEDDQLPVMVPTLMTEKEFNDLPDFGGF